MNKKFIQIIAIVGLVFTVAFSVLLVMTLINPALLGGNITTATISVGAFALVLFVVVYLDKRTERKNEELQRQQEEERLAGEIAREAGAPQPDKPAESDPDA